MDATGHRWVAALSSYNFTLTYRSGKSNGDADGLSRRPQENTELFPEVVKAIRQAYTVQRDTCPYAETLVLTSSPQLVMSEQADTQVLDSIDLASVNWSKEQVSDKKKKKTLSRVIDFIHTGHCPAKNELRFEIPDVNKYIREWSKLTMIDNV